jgi:D-tyrosyl-tRNA(Tyr) deacylase
VDGEQVGAIGQGLLVYLGVGPQDDEMVARHLAARLAGLRIFADQAGTLNRSALEVGAGILLVSQFTLFADLRHGHRPSFLGAGPPDLGRALCGQVARALTDLGIDPVAQGSFGAHMTVDSRNDGPVTIVASSGEPPWAADCG